MKGQLLFFWIDEQLISKRVDHLFGDGSSEKLANEKFNRRGVIRDLASLPGLKDKVLKGTIEQLEDQSRDAMSANDEEDTEPIPQEVKVVGEADGWKLQMDMKCKKNGRIAPSCIQILRLNFDGRDQAVKLKDLKEADVNELMHGLKDKTNVIFTVSTVGSKCYIEQCSFLNAAKGNVIFDQLHISDSVHGAVMFGGGEAVLFELSTFYLNSNSGFECNLVAVFPHSRGKEKVDPSLPKHVGSKFKD